MTRDLALLTVTAYLREEFGRLLEARDARRVRRAAGDCWLVTLVAVPSSGDLHVGEVDVDEHGVIAPKPSVDDVILALQRTTVIERYPSLPPSMLAAAASSDSSSDEIPDALADLGAEPAAPTDARAPTEPPVEGTEAVRARVQALLAKGDRASLDDARELMPRLLGDPDRRGMTLLRMGELERRLGQPKLALDYAEAAAREFADRFDMPGLEKAAGLSIDLLGKEGFLECAVHGLLERCRARLVPLESMFEAPALAPVPAADRRWLDVQARLRTLSAGETLVREGEPSRAIFIVKSGLVGVHLERADGPARLVRCCFPGWLLGESSVLVDGDARCSATLRAQRVTELWQLDAQVVRDVMRTSPALTDAIGHTKQIHRLDSFFSMHEAMGQLDVQVRDEMLGCIERIQSFDEDTVVIPPGEVPAVACLVARGALALHRGWDLEQAPHDVVGVDRFVGVRDAIHAIPVDCSAVARAGSTIAFFDADRLRALVAESGDRVASVLERLG